VFARFPAGVTIAVTREKVQSGDILELEEIAGFDNSGICNPGTPMEVPETSLTDDGEL